jgi:hypothetical protein
VLKSFVYKVIDGLYGQGSGDAFSSVIWVGSNNIELAYWVLID